MNCREFQDRLSDFADGELDEDQVLLLTEHVRECAGCKASYENTLLIKRELQETGERPLPEGFHAELMGRIRADRKPSSAGSKIDAGLARRVGKWAYGVAASLLLLVVIGYGAASLVLGGAAKDGGGAPPYTGLELGSAANESGGVTPQAGLELGSAAGLRAESADSDQGMDAKAAGYSVFTAQTGSEVVVSNLMINITVKDYEGAKAFVESYGGLVASKSTSEWDTGGEMSATLNVPKLIYPAVLSQLRSLGEVTYENESAQVHTSSYKESAVRAEALTAQAGRLLELYEISDSVSDLITVENRLDNVAYELDAYKTKLAQLSEQSAYPRIRLILSSDDGFVPVAAGFGERLMNSMQRAANGLSAFVVGLAGAFFQLVLAALIIFAVVKITLGVVSPKKAGNSI